MTNKFRPQLAATIETGEGDHKALRFPLLASPKFDGIRGLVMPRGLVSRKLKRIPSKLLQDMFDVADLAYADGELICGLPTAEGCMQRSSSAVMSEDSDDANNVRFYVFDSFRMPEVRYDRRLKSIEQLAHDLFNVVIVKQTLVQSLDEALAYEQELVEQGYEGMMLRDPAAPYKFGRSTLREQYLMKWKRFMDGEAEVLGTYEQVKNTNELEKDELGYAKRSSAKDGKVPMGRLGGFSVRDVKTGVEFEVGTGRGLTLELRELWWPNRKALVGKIIHYRYQPTGVKDKPRFPVFISFRDRRDM